MNNRKNKIGEEKARTYVPNWRQQPRIQPSAQTATDLSSADRDIRCIAQSAAGWPASALWHVRPTWPYRDSLNWGNSISPTQVGQHPTSHHSPPRGATAFPPPPKHWWNRVSHLLAPSLSLTRLLHCFLPTTAPPPAALKPPPTPLTPFKPAVCSSYPNTGELNLLVTQHTCSRTSCAQSTEKSLT